MEKLENILDLMKRMRLFPETNCLHEKFIVEDKKVDLLEEEVFKSYEFNDIIKILLKHYDLGNEENFLKNGNEIGVDYGGCYNENGIPLNNEIVYMSLVIPNGFLDIEKIKKFMDSCGWTLAQEKVYHVNNDYTVYYFQKNRQVKEVELPDYLYHLTSENKLQKILEKGLVPRSSNVLSNRPERIYMLREKPSLFFCISFAQQLYKASLERKLNFSGLTKQEIGEKLNQPRTEKYCLLSIDTAKCNNLKILGDPDMDNAVWTYDNIPPQAITVIKKNI